MERSKAYSATTETKFQTAIKIAAPKLLVNSKRRPINSPLGGRLNKSINQVVPAKRGARSEQRRSIVLKVAFIFANRSLSLSAITIIQSFSTAIFVPTEARLAITAKMIVMGAKADVAFSGHSSCPTRPKKMAKIVQHRATMEFWIPKKVLAVVKRLFLSTHAPTKLPKMITEMLVENP